MLDLFSSLKSLLKINNVCIDNNVFRLHYKATAVILIGFSLFVTSRQYIGDPIDCIYEDARLSIMDNYCWIYSTFTLPNRMIGRVGVDTVQPGIAPYVEGEDTVKYHKYYQWVCFVLFFQAMFFYLPRFLWKMWEGGRMKSLAVDLDGPIVSDDCKAIRKTFIIDYFITNLHAQNFYAARFFLCELFNFVNVIGQIYFMDYFLDGEFRTYGLDVLRYTDLKPEERVDPMARVFPKVTKCTFHKFGPSGTLQNFDGLCVLTLNNVNEKIYVFLWYWFWFVAVISFFNVVYRIAVIFMSKLRLVLLSARSRLTPKDEMEIINRKFQIGDWFVLYQLGHNINPIMFKELVSDLAAKLDGKGSV